MVVKLGRAAVHGTAETLRTSMHAENGSFLGTDYFAIGLSLHRTQMEVPVSTTTVLSGTGSTSTTTRSLRPSSCSCI